MEMSIVAIRTHIEWIFKWSLRKFWFPFNLKFLNHYFSHYGIFGTATMELEDRLHFLNLL